LDFPGLLGGNGKQYEGKQDQSYPLWDLLAEVNPNEGCGDPGQTSEHGKSHIYIAFSQVGNGSRYC
jgi:hypothetical protein